MGSIISAIEDKIREHGSLAKYQEYLRETAFLPQSTVRPNLSEFEPETSERRRYKKHKEGFKITIEHKLNTKLKGRDTSDGRTLYPIYVIVVAKRKMHYFPSCHLFYVRPDDFDHFRNTELVKTLFTEESDIIKKWVIEYYNDPANNNKSNWLKLYKSRFPDSSTFHQQSHLIEQIKSLFADKVYYKCKNAEIKRYPVFKDSEGNEVWNGSIIKIIEHATSEKLNRTTARVKWLKELGRYEYFPDDDTGSRSFDLVTNFVVIN